MKRTVVWMACTRTTRRRMPKQRSSHESAPRNGRHRPVRPTLSAERPVEGQAAPPFRPDGHSAADLKWQQPAKRLGPGIRLPVLALPSCRLPRRRRFRPVLHRGTGAGRGCGYHERHQGPVRRQWPGAVCPTSRFSTACNAGRRKE
jgi:hypothetical protein